MINGIIFCAIIVASYLRESLGSKVPLFSPIETPLKSSVDGTWKISRSTNKPRYAELSSKASILASSRLSERRDNADLSSSSSSEDATVPQQDCDRDIPILKDLIDESLAARIPAPPTSTVHGYRSNKSISNLDLEQLMFQLIETQKLRQQLLLRQWTLIAKELELAQKQDEILIRQIAKHSLHNH